MSSARHGAFGIWTTLGLEGNQSLQKGLAVVIRHPIGMAGGNAYGLGQIGFSATPDGPRIQIFKPGSIKSRVDRVSVISRGKYSS